MVGAKRRKIGLGAYPEVGLALARQKAAERRDVIRSGVDPVEQGMAACADPVAAQKLGLIFSKAVDLFEPVRVAERSGGKYRDQWRNSLDSHAIPILGKMLVQDIQLQDILLVLEPIWHAKTVTADKLRRKLAELIWRRSGETRRRAETAIFQYINGFYSPRRRHSALGGKSPLAFECQVA
jgi:transposase InsO family protein